MKLVNIAKAAELSKRLKDLDILRRASTGRRSYGDTRCVIGILRGVGRGEIDTDETVDVDVTTFCKFIDSEIARTKAELTEIGVEVS